MKHPGRARSPKKRIFSTPDAGILFWKDPQLEPRGGAPPAELTRIARPPPILRTHAFIPFSAKSKGFFAVLKVRCSRPYGQPLRRRMCGQPGNRHLRVIPTLSGSGYCCCPPILISQPGITIPSPDAEGEQLWKT